MAGLPIVKFLCGPEVPVKAIRWTFKMGGGVLVSRKQIPLKLAWAISIHKSQVTYSIHFTCLVVIQKGLINDCERLDKLLQVHTILLLCFVKFAIFLLDPTHFSTNHHFISSVLCRLPGRC